MALTCILQEDNLRVEDIANFIYQNPGDEREVCQPVDHDKREPAT